MNHFRQITTVLMLAAVLVSFTMPVWAEGAEMININTATVAELTKLKRIGPAYAEKIVEFREQNGPFKTPEEITKVQGIGEKTFEVNKDVISVE